MRFRTLLAALFVSFVALAGLALAMPTAAFADDPVDLHGADVLDRADVLGSKTGDVQAALDKLAADTNLELFVVYVDSFDNPSDAKQWADATAIENGLGPDDALLAIAVNDKIYRWSVDASFPVSDSQLDDIGSKVEDALHDGDWAGGAITAAQQIEASQAPSPVPLIIGGVVVVGVGGAFAGRAIAKRRAKTKVARAATDAQKALDAQAGTLLVGLDDALKTSEQELGFAQAQFGEDATKDFSTALASAQDDAKQAFAIQQKLDDAFPETPDERKTMSEQLIALAQKADATLDAQTAAFDQLRQLEKNAPQVLDTVTTTRAGLADLITAAKTKVDGFAARFPGADLTSIEDAPAQAHKLDVFAGTAIDKAKAAIAKGADSSDAAMAVRVAQQAVGQIQQLLTSIDARETELAAQQERNSQSQRQLGDELSDARAQIQTTQDFITTHRGAVGSVARTRVSEAQRRLDDATKLGATDPVAALAEAQSAEQLASQALGSARDDVASYQSPGGYGGGILGTAIGQQSQPTVQYDGTDGATLGGILGTIFGAGLGASLGNSGPGPGYGNNNGGLFGGGSSWGGGGGSSWHPGGFGGSSSHGGGFGGGGGSSSSSSGSSSGGRRGGGGRF